MAGGAGLDFRQAGRLVDGLAAVEDGDEEVDVAGLCGNGFGARGIGGVADHGSVRAALGDIEDGIADEVMVLGEAADLEDAGERRFGCLFAPFHFRGP